MLEELVIVCPNLAVIEYHFNDDYSNVYADARIEYYNVLAYPNTHIDGFWQPDWNNQQAYEDAYMARMETATNYTVALELEGDGTNFTGTANVSWFGSSNADKVLHLVLTESHIEESWYGGEEVNYVARLMIPDQYGTPLEGGKSPEEVFDFEFTLEPGWSKDSCELVAFVQDTLTQEIFQANSMLLSDVEIDYYDVALESIVSPVEHHCTSNLEPVIEIKNLCNQFLTSFEVTYEINGELYQHTWTGNVFPGLSQLVVLPAVNVDLLDENSILVSLSLPNGEADQNPANDSQEKTFTEAPLLEEGLLVLELLTDDMGSETSWLLQNGNGDIIDQGSGFADNTLYEFEWELTENDCYTFIMEDEGGNGICCENGAGYYRIKSQAGVVLFEGGAFETTEQVLFNLDLSTATHTPSTGIGQVEIFPNPAHNWVNIKSTTAIEKVMVYNNTGRLVYEKKGQSEQFSLNTSQLARGLYLFRIETKDGIQAESVIID